MTILRFRLLLPVGSALAFATAAFAVASRGYDPLRGVLGRAPRDET